MFKITFEERKQKTMLQTSPEYNIMLNGQFHEILYYNMSGYVGSLPLPNGGKLNSGECGLAKWKKEARIIEKETRNSK